MYQNVLDKQKQGIRAAQPMSIDKLRLLLFEECNRSCPGCCNRDWDLQPLPVCYDLPPYRIILLTGGEPMLYP